MATATKKAAVKPFKIPKVTKKQVATHRTKSARDPSPSWDGATEMDAEAFTRNFRNAMEYYRLETSVKELRPKVVEWMELNSYSKDQTVAFRKLRDGRISSTLCGVVACLVRGMPEIHDGFNNGKDSAAWVHNELDRAMRAGKNDMAEEKEDQPVVKKETIQDRLAEKFSEAMGEIEGAIDDFIKEGKEFSAYKFLQGQNIAVQYATKIPDIIQPKINEMNELLKGKDSQLMEGYKHLGKRDVNKLIKFYEAIISDAMAYKNSKMAARAKPKRKPVSPEKQVRSLKYLKEFAELGLKSIVPTDILEMSELWVYNTKTRKLGRFVVSMHGDMSVGQLGVKGSAITGFDELKSTCKTLRKPAEKLAEFKTQGKPGLRKFMDTIKSVETRIKGRISPETILLRVVK